MAQGSLSAKISFDLSAFCPDFIFVVYDKDSRHHAESAAEQKKTNAASHEHQGAKLRWADVLLLLLLLLRLLLLPAVLKSLFVLV